MIEVKLNFFLTSEKPPANYQKALIAVREEGTRKLVITGVALYAAGSRQWFERRGGRPDSVLALSVDEVWYAILPDQLEEIQNHGNA